jgi:hypothetical protein
MRSKNEQPVSKSYQCRYCYCFDDFLAPVVQTSPERHLLLAILRRALMDLIGYDICHDAKNSAMTFRRDAWKWLTDARCDGNKEFSASWVCEHLGLNRECLEKQVLQAVESGDFSGFRGVIDSPESKRHPNLMSIRMRHRVN